MAQKHYKDCGFNKYMTQTNITPKHRDYFEGILQLRDIKKEMLTFAEKEIEARKEVFIAKKVKVRGGYDLYLSSWRFLITLGKSLQRKYSGEIKTSRSLFSQNRQTSKKVYRVTVMFRPITQRIGQIVDYRDQKVKILKLSKKIEAKNMQTGKKFFIDYDELRK